MVYNLSLINYAGAEMKQLKELEKEISAKLDQVNQTSKEIQHMTKDLKGGIEDMSGNQTEEMQQMTKDLKELIKAANKSQTEKMQQLTNDLKDEIEDMTGNQTMRMDVLNEKVSDLSKQIATGRPDRTGGKS